MTVATTDRYLGYRRPGVRLREPVIPEMAAHRGDRPLPIIGGVHRFDKAHLVMLAETGIVGKEDVAAMLSILRSIEADGMAEARRAAGGGIHSGEHLLISRLGERIGGRISVGRSSADIGAVALRLLEKDRLLTLLGALDELRATVLGSAGAHVGTLIAGRTQGQPAQVTTVGHVLAGWAAALGRHAERCRQVLDRVDRSPAGAAMMVGAAFPVDRERTARLLGFAGPLDNTYDAVSHHDHVVDCLAALAQIGADLSRWSDDLLLWSSPEHGAVEIPDRFCGTSSILAQAKNAYMPQLVKGAAAIGIGALTAALSVDRGATGTAVLDRHGTSAQLVEQFDSITRHLGWWSRLLPTLRWSAGTVGDHFVTATEAAALLVRDHGLSWRQAHQVIAVAVRRAEDEGCPRLDAPGIEAAATEYLGAPIGVDPNRLTAVLDPAAAVRSRTILGGPAPQQVAASCAGFRRQLTADRADLDARRGSEDHALAALEAAIDDLLNP